MEAGPMNTVIAAIDNSAAATPVLAMACALAPVLGADVQAVHVREDDGRTAQGSADSYHVAFKTLSGDPLDILVHLAADDDVVAFVLGTRTGPGGRRPAGHLALALADHINKPVVVVPPDTTPASELRRVVIAMEGVPGKARTLKRAVDLAAAAALELIVVHVDDETSIPLFSDQIQHETESYAREFLARYCPGAPDARLELRIGLPAEQILATAEQAQADILAIGWPPTSDPNRGLVAREILDRGHMPVLLVAIA
jgi:nucleotide-binding universal stress UspA family protein